MYFEIKCISRANSPGPKNSDPKEFDVEPAALDTTPAAYVLSAQPTSIFAGRLTARTCNAGHLVARKVNLSHFSVKLAIYARRPTMLQKDQWMSGFAPVLPDWTTTIMLSGRIAAHR
jgi:hypothetical protein